MKVHYLGPTKTFSEQAAIIFSEEFESQCQLVALSSFESIAKVVKVSANTLLNVGVLPYYNFLEGLVQESLDLIFEYDLQIERSARVTIEFSIGGVQADLKPTVVYSHPKALAQCSEFIESALAGAEMKAVSSTAEAARIVRDAGDGYAIANRAALAEHRLSVIQDNIGNQRQGRTNFTDFLLVSPQRLLPIQEAKSHRTMVAITPDIDTIGLLAGILGQFSYYRLNIAKIHSRPAINAVPMIELEPQMFYLEVVCREDSDALNRCLESINYHFQSDNAVKLLGGFSALD